MQAFYTNPMIFPLAVYRFWAGIFFSPAAKTADAPIDAATTMPVEITDGARQLRRVGRKPHYVSARIRKAQRDAG